MRSQSYQHPFEPFLENRRSFLLLRWLVIILASYLILFSNLSNQSFRNIALVLAGFFASNVIVALLPVRAFVIAQSRYLIALSDALFISGCLYILRFPGPLIHIPFIAIFLMAIIWSDLRIVLFSLFVISILFGVFSYFSLFGFGIDVPIDRFLGLSLFFVVAIFYVFLANRFDRDTATATVMLEERRNSEIMVEMTRTLSTSMNSDEIYRVIVGRLSDAMDGAEFSIVRVQGDRAIVLASSADEDEGETVDPIPLDRVPALRQAYEEKQTVSSAETESKGGDKFSGRKLAVPMITQGEVVGLIYYRGGPIDVEPSRTTVHLFEVVASTAANALRNVQLFEEMKHMARTDFLTGLPNHRYFQSALAREVGRAKRHSRPLSLLVLDLDFLKAVNDRFGHPAGDSVIRSVASTIRATCREIDFPARYGGEEYVVILPETDLHGAIEVAERLRKNIEETDVGSVGHVTASVGVANFPINADSKEDLIRVADQALYVAKNGGRNQVAHFEHQLTS